MTNAELALIVMSSIVLGVSLFGAVWYRIERNQSNLGQRRPVASEDAISSALSPNLEHSYPPATGRHFRGTR